MTTQDLPDLAHYYFIPTVREGLAALITTDAPIDGRAQIAARLTPNVDGEDRETISRVIGLYGPGDVVGFDQSVITRTDPRKNVWDFEPNYMPMVELSEPDLPWRFTPMQATAPTGQLMPWITLIVLEQDAGEFGGLEQRLPDKYKKKALPIRWIRDVEVAKLPDLSYAWMWAHAHVTGRNDMEDGTALQDAISRNPGEPDDLEEPTHVLSRLLCPRRLAAKKKYTAFIVPTFKAGQVAAGVAVLGDGENPLDPGWGTSSPQKIDLPYYYKWDFATGVRGDFEYLVELLQPRSLPRVGKRRMDCSSVAYGLPDCPGDSSADPHVLELEGALMSPDLEFGAWHSSSAFRTELAGVLNMPAAVPRTEAGVAGRPPVVPPVYGRWHTRQRLVDPSTVDRWMDDANLDPRLRAAAGFGALVVQKEQEALKASLWDQLGDIDIANQWLRHGQLGLEASKGVFKRLGLLGLPAFLWTTAPVFARVRAPASLSPTPTTITHYLNTSNVPAAAFDPAFRRIDRPRGGIRKQQRRVPSPQPGQDLLSRLNRGDIAAAGPPPTLVGMPSLCAVTTRAIERLRGSRAPTAAGAGIYRIEGTVLRRSTARPVVGARVEVWDKDPFFNDLLGSTTTDAQGEFVVEFDDSYFKEMFLDPKPDLFVKVLRHGVQINNPPAAVMRNVAPGTHRIEVRADDTEPPPAAAGSGLTVFDFCEESITAAEVASAAVNDGQPLDAQAAAAIAGALTEWLTPLPSSKPTPIVADLDLVFQTVKAAVTPTTTIPARLATRIKTLPGVHAKGELGLLESEVEFPQPMYEPLAAISQDLILPGVETVPMNTISLLQTNRRFIEAYFMGLNTAFAGEALWIGAPVFLSTTFFKQFWDVRGLVDPASNPEEAQDISSMTTWTRASALGSHTARPGESAESAVLLIRGDLLKRYPNTLIYAVAALENGDPALAGYGDVTVESEVRVWPIFSGSLTPDLSFMGFSKSPEQLCEGNGHFIVIEERLSEPRFGFDLMDPEPATKPEMSTAGNWWYETTWSHLGVQEGSYVDGSAPQPAGSGSLAWGASSAVMGNIALQRPVRVSIHASKMLSKQACAE
jgi:hypothetical protein